MISSRVSLFPVVIVLSFASLQAGFTSCASVSSNISSLGGSVASCVAQKGSQKSVVDTVDKSSSVVVVKVDDFLQIARDAELIKELMNVLGHMSRLLERDARIDVDAVLKQATAAVENAASSHNSDVQWLARCVDRTSESVIKLLVKEVSEKHVAASDSSKGKEVQGLGILSWFGVRD